MSIHRIIAKPMLLAAATLLLACIQTTGAAEKALPKLVYATYSPKPKYPISAGMRGAHGSGVFVMRVQIKSGRVKEVYVARSTGHADLDAAAMAALKRWRFPPNTLPPIEKITPHKKDPFAKEDSLIREPVSFDIP